VWTGWERGILQAQYLGIFLERFASAENDEAFNASAPVEILPSEQGALYGAEIWRLARSLQIAAILGDAPARTAVAAELICGNVKEARCSSLDAKDAWIPAIKWAIAQIPPSDGSTESLNWYARQRPVGLACKHLRGRGFQVSAGAYGPEISSQVSNRFQVRPPFASNTDPSGRDESARMSARQLG
jgi:hypothetical protein